MVFEFVYTSVLSSTADVLGFGGLIRRARRYNLDHGITGVLIFDGGRFCHHLEGEQEAVLQLAARIYVDPRHQQFTVVHQGLIEERRFAAWSLAYALDTRGVLQDVIQSRGLKAVDVLCQRLGDLQIQPSSN